MRSTAHSPRSADQLARLWRPIRLDPTDINLNLMFEAMIGTIMLLRDGVTS
jgi:hypothetical protein